MLNVDMKDNGERDKIRDFVTNSYYNHNKGVYKLVLGIFVKFISEFPRNLTITALFTTNF